MPQNVHGQLGETKPSLCLLFDADLGNDNAASRQTLLLPRVLLWEAARQRRELEGALAFGGTSSHLRFAVLAGKPSDGNGFQLLLPDGDVNQGLQTEIASRLNLKCLGTFYFCPRCLLGAAAVSRPASCP